MQHLQHFGLSQDAFRNEPDLRFYFESACHVDAFRRVERGLRQNKALTLLTGEAGTGKTLLARRLFEGLEEELFEANLMMILPGAADSGSVLSRFARQLGVDDPASDRAALLAQLYDHLAIVREDGRHAILIIDDAHILSVDALAEVGGLLNLEYEDRGLLSLMLCGLPELETRLQGESALHQRVDVRVRVQPLDLANTRSYLAHRLAVAGGQPTIVPDAVVDALHKFSRGRPRLVNTLVDNAMFEAFLEGRSVVEPRDIERAAGDLAVGDEPGTTYTSLAPAVAPPPELADAFNAPIAPPEPVIGGGNDDIVAPPMSPPPGPADLEALLEPPTGGGADELTTLLDADFGDSPATELFMEAEPAHLSPQPGDSLPSFEASNSGGGGAEATRIDLGEEAEAETARPQVQDLDDLFVELIEE